MSLMAWHTIHVLYVLDEVSWAEVMIVVKFDPSPGVGSAGTMIRRTCHVKPYPKYAYDGFRHDDHCVRADELECSISTDCTRFPHIYVPPLGLDKAQNKSTLSFIKHPP